MRADRPVPPGWRRRGLQATITLLGLLSIVGSGGGSGPECSFFSNVCNPVIGPLPPFAIVEIHPAATTAQVGSNAVFEARTVNLSQATYAWCRIPAGGSDCAAIAGADAARLVVVGVNLADDGARYRVTATGTEGVAIAVGQLAVSAMPGVEYADGEFLESDWAVSAIVEPAQGKPGYNTARATTGGNPGAFQQASYTLDSVPASVLLLHRALKASYEPASQGAIYRIDFSEDCIGLSSNFLPYTVPLIQQGSRWYTANGLAHRTCAADAWQAVTVRSSLSDRDFVLVQGPACGAGESCPDFSAGGATIGLGLASAAALSSGLPPGTTAQFAHGFDNWKATVWRH